jgi:acetoin utilization protein AcuB
MSTHPFSVHPSAPVEKAAHLLMTNKIGSLPVVEDGRLVGIITATDMLRALEAVLGADGSSRIDLNLDGSGEIAAATSLVQTICPLLGIGTYRRKNAEREVLYVQVSSTNAQRAADALKEFGFKVLAVHS